MKKGIDTTTQELTVIKTARTEKAINQAAKAGFLPQVKPVKPSKRIHSKFCVWQEVTTGEIVVVGDFRAGPPNANWKKVIDWTDYYPHVFPEPFAAYLIPRDLKPGQRVFVEDVIDDFVEAEWNQGDVFRLESCEAVWTGEDLRIKRPRGRDRVEMVG